MTTEERRATLEVIASEVRACDRCRLSQTRTKAVPGEGHADTEVVFVGEGPGQREDQQGRPFVGAAGNLLGELLGLVGWTRDDVFITNVVKCRPPGNRDPEPDEIAACEPFLRRQLEVLDPALLVTLGRFSLQMFMPGDRISRVHGTERPVDPSSGARAATGYAMYHPAAALRQGALKETMQRDMAAIPAALLRARTAREGVAAAPDATPQDPHETATAPPVSDSVVSASPALEGAATATPRVSVAPDQPPSPTPPDPSTAVDAAPAAVDGTTPEVPDDQLGLF